MDRGKERGNEGREEGIGESEGMEGKWKGESEGERKERIGERIQVGGGGKHRGKKGGMQLRERKGGWDGGNEGRRMRVREERKEKVGKREEERD